MALAETSRRSSTRCRRTGPTSSSTCASQEDRYIDAATLLVTCNAQPYSHHDWHWRLLVAHQFGHAAAAPAVHGTLKLLDDAGHRGRARRCASCAPAASRRPRCGAAPSRCGRSSAASARSRWPASSRSSTTCCSAPTCSACCARPATRRSWPGADQAQPAGAAVLIVDLADDRLRRRRAGRATCAASGELEGDPHARRLLARRRTTPSERAEAAGFDLVVPRSRMAREGPALVERLAGDRSCGSARYEKARSR